MFAILYTLAGWVGGATAHAPLHPRGADLYVEIADGQALMQAYRSAPSARFLDDEGIAKLGGLAGQMGLDFGAILRASTPRLSPDPTQTNLYVAGDLQTASLSLSGVDPDPGDNGSLEERVGLLVVLDFATAQGAEHADEALRKAAWLSPVESPAGATPTQETLELNGSRSLVRRHRLDAPLLELDAWSAVFGTRWILGAGRTTPAALGQRADEASGGLPEAGELFAAEKHFSAPQGTQVARLYSDLATVPFADPANPMLGAVLSTLVPFAGARGVWRIQLHDGRFVTEGVYTRIDATNPLDRLVMHAPVQRSSAARIPETAVGAWLGQVRVGELPLLFDAWMGASRKPLPAASRPSTEEEQRRTARLEEALTKGLGPNAVVSLLPFAGLQSMVPQVLVSLDLKDRASAEAATTALVEHVLAANPDATVEERMYRKVRMVTLSMPDEGPDSAEAAAPSGLGALPFLGALGGDAPTPCIALLADRLLIGLKPSHVRTEIQRVEKAGAEAEPRPAHPLSGEGSAPADAVEVSTLDWSGLFGKLYDLARSFAPMLTQGQATPIDPATLPPSSSFTRYFKPSISWTRTIEAGTYTRSESSLGPEAPLTMLALFHGMGSGSAGATNPLGALMGGAMRRPPAGDAASAAQPSKPETTEPAKDEARERTIVSLRSIRTGVAVYRSQKGRAPAKLAGLLEATESFPQGFLDPPLLPKDGWGRELRYEPDAEGAKYKLWSLGPDGVDQQGTGDDVALP